MKNFARSVFFSDIQIHDYWCFELAIKISLSLRRVSFEERHFDNFFSWKTIQLRHFEHLFHGKTSYLGKICNQNDIIFHRYDILKHD